MIDTFVHYFAANFLAWDADWSGNWNKIGKDGENQSRCSADSIGKNLAVSHGCLPHFYIHTTYICSEVTHSMLSTYTVWYVSKISVAPTVKLQFYITPLNVTQTIWTDIITISG